MWAGRSPGKGSTWVNIWRRAAGGSLGCSTLGRGISKCKDPGGMMPGVLETESQAGERRTVRDRQQGIRKMFASTNGCTMWTSRKPCTSGKQWQLKPPPRHYCVLGVTGLLQRTTLPQMTREGTWMTPLCTYDRDRQTLQISILCLIND